MKKKNVLVIASIVHLALWIIFLLASVVLKHTYYAPEMDPLDFALSKGMYNVFIGVAMAGIMNAAILFLSLRAVSLHSKTKSRKKRIAALCLSVMATILFYSTIPLLFIINTDALISLPVIWILCELCCGGLLVFS